MGRTFMTVGRGRLRPRSRRERREATARALTAAGIQPTYDLVYGSQIGLAFEQAVAKAGYIELAGTSWPCEAELSAVPGHLLFRDGDATVTVLADGTIAKFALGYGQARVVVAASSQRLAHDCIDAFQALFPATYLNATDERVPITFWTHGPHGATTRLRMIDASPWADIERNYAAEVREKLAGMMAGFKPGEGGQLILWQGPPGTGKTWALRALVSEWLPWAEFHYITDPDAFFVDQPSYMIDVLLADSYGAIDFATGDVYDEPGSDKWRVLVLEDTGELLSANAKEKYGQGLSRLLNVVDGLIGQGLRVLVLVTTNDELGELNPAVRRPGRCAAQITFSPLSPEDAAAWLGEEVEDGLTLAELYARASDQPVEEQIAEVAEKHQPDGGYGETAWNPETATVMWICGDWTSNEEIDAAEDDFLAIAGVDHFEYEAEAMPTGWCDAQYVYPAGYKRPSYWCQDAADAAAASGVLSADAVDAAEIPAGEPAGRENGAESREEDAFERVLALARAPLPLDGTPVVEDAIRALAASAEVSPANSAALTAALDTIRVMQQTGTDAVSALLASALKGHEGSRGDALALTALGVLQKFAERPADPAPHVEVHTPKHDLHVQVEPARSEHHIHLPEQLAPVVNVEGAHVEMPAPHVEVHVPEQPTPPAPVVHTHVAAPSPTPVIVNVEQPRPRAIRTIEDPETGETIYVPEEVEQ